MEDGEELSVANTVPPFDATEMYQSMLTIGVETFSSGSLRLRKMMVYGAVTSDQHAAVTSALETAWRTIRMCILAIYPRCLDLLVLCIMIFFIVCLYWIWFQLYIVFHSSFQRRGKC